MNALEIKLDKIYKQAVTQRKQEQDKLLQKFVNLKQKLDMRQRVETSKLDKAFEVKEAKNRLIK